MNFKLSNLVKLGAFVVPIVPGAAMAHEVFLSSLNMEVWGEYLLIVGLLSLAGGIAFEIVGIGAGHVMVQMFNAKKWIYFSVAVVTMTAYIAVGLYKLGLSTFGLFFIMAPFVYLLSGLVELAEETAEDTKAERIAARRAEKEEREFERQQRALDAEAKRKIKEQKATAKLVSTVSREVSKSSLQMVYEMVSRGEFDAILPRVKGPKKLIIETLKETPEETSSKLTAKLADKLGTTPQNIGKHAKGLLDIATQFSQN